MDHVFTRMRTIFLVAFAVCVAAVWGYQLYWVAPRQACEERRNWWDPASRTCGHVVYIPDITHRPAGLKSPPSRG